MRLFLSVLVASVAFSGAALADPDANLFGNTVVITSDAGVTKARVNSDHTYATTLFDGTSVKGTWASLGGQTCYTQTEPAPAADAKPFCVKDEAHNVGDSWEAPGADGKPVKYQLVAGQ